MTGWTGVYADDQLQKASLFLPTQVPPEEPPLRQAAGLAELKLCCDHHVKIVHALHDSRFIKHQAPFSGFYIQ